jgi:hypothetical protein
MARNAPVVQDFEPASAMNIRPLALALGLVLAAPLGCAGSYIPNTTVEDSSENRRVISFCEKYRRAVEDRDVDTLVSMASPRYFETGGNAKASDDIDYNGLRAYLTEKFKHTKQIRYEIRYHRVIEAENKVISVEFTYTASFQIPTAGGDMWHRAVRDNQLQLLRDGKNDSFQILRGM